MAGETFSFYVLLPDSEHHRALGVPAEGGWTLPRFEVPAGPDTGLLSVAVANHAVRERFGARVTSFHSIHVRDPETQALYHLFTLENHTPGWEAPPGTRWLSRPDVEEVLLEPDVLRTVLRTWFAEQHSPERLVPWWKPGWMQSAESWMRAEIRCRGLQTTGPVEQVKSWYLGSILRASTDGGDVYFKAQAEPSGGEAGVTAALARWRPERLPRVLAVDPARGWLLAADIGGISLDTSADPEAWEEAARAYGQLQVQSLDLPERDRPALADRATPAMRERIAPFFEEVDGLMTGLRQRLTKSELEELRRVIPDLEQRCDAVMSYGIPHALEHGDFHAANVRMTPAGPVFYDWSEACIGHPFFGLATLLDADDWLPPVEGVRERIRDAYLETWTGWEPLERSRELFGKLQPLWELEASLRCGERVAFWQNLIPWPPLPYSGAEWSLRQQQYGLATSLRKLLPPAQ